MKKTRVKGVAEPVSNGYNFHNSQGITELPHSGPTLCSRRIGEGVLGFEHPPSRLYNAAKQHHGLPWSALRVLSVGPQERSHENDAYRLTEFAVAPVEG
jgi:hypothetical protein